MRLNADLVILSACNTAGGDGSEIYGSEALSGLARAFFYAGSSSILVSEWPVNSKAAVRLTTGMILNGQRTGVYDAEALRESMLTVMGDDSFAHPKFWAPFILVGGEVATAN